MFYFWLGIETEDIQAEREDRKAVNDWVHSVFAGDLALTGQKLLV